MGEEGKTAGQPRDRGRFSFKSLQAGDPVRIDGGEPPASDAVIIAHVKRPFEDMVDTLTSEDRERYNQISDGYAAPEDLISIAEDPDAPVALKFAIARMHPSFVEWGLESDDWRVQAGALTNPLCDINEVDIDRIDGRAMDAKIVSVHIGEVVSQSVLVKH